MSLVCHHLGLPQFLRYPKSRFSSPAPSTTPSARCVLRRSPAVSCFQKQRGGASLGQKVCHRMMCSASSSLSSPIFRVNEGVGMRGCKRAHRGYGDVRVYYNSGGSPGGGNSQQDIIIRNLVGAGLLVLLTYTGLLRVLFDIIASIWILFILLVLGAVGSYAAFAWWAQGKLVTGTCPSCGQEFQALGETPLNQKQVCPQCAAPFEVLNKKFVRVEPQFAPDPFAGFGFGSKQKQGSSTSSNRKSDAANAIVDIEAEVMDKD